MKDNKIKLSPEDITDHTYGKMLRLCIHLTQQMSTINAKVDDLIVRVDRVEKNQQTLSRGHARILQNQMAFAQGAKQSASKQVEQKQQKPIPENNNSESDDDAPASPREYDPPQFN